MALAREQPGRPEASAEPIVLRVHPQVLSHPRRAPEVELVGAMQDTGFSEEQWLICYDGEQYIQATELLYHVLLYADGTTEIADIAEQVSRDTGTELTPEDVRWLVEQRLAPSGLLDLSPRRDAEQLDDEDEHGDSIEDDLADGSPPPLVQPPKDPPILAIRYRVPLFPYSVTSPITSMLKYLYAPSLMVALIIVAIGVNVSVFMNPELLQAIGTILYRPELVLGLFAIELLSVLFHELGHAAALKRAGCRYGVIGFALYIIWPVFYTDVTHVYRLNRMNRLRVDLGGMYFQLISMVVMYAIYLATGSEVFLLAIPLTLSSFLQQFTPFLRFDGYYTIADTIGVNEPLALVKPFVLDHLPWRRHKPKLLPPMRRWAKAAFCVYLLFVIGFVIYPFAFGAFAGSEIVNGVISSGEYHWDLLVNSARSGDPVAFTSATVQSLMWCLVPIGLALFVYRLTRLTLQAVRGIVRLLGHRIRRGRPVPEGA